MLENSNNPKQLQKELDSLHFLIQGSISIYDYNGNQLAKAGPFPGAPLSKEKLAKLGRRPLIRRNSLAISLPEEYLKNSYLILSHDRKDIHKRFSLLLAAILIFLALLTYPLTRFILWPVNKISKTASALASGDLSARTGVSRGDELGLLANTIDNMAERLDNLIKSEREMLANISHEFRTPLARMRIALELSAEGSDLQTIQSYINEMNEDINELDQLVADVLMAVRLQLNQEESTAIIITPVTININDFINQAVHRFKQKHSNFPVKIIARQGITDIFGEPLLLHRVLANILENCVKHSQSSKAIEINLTSAEHLIVSIIDHGKGILENNTNRLFEPFFRGDYSRSHGGVGLGLTLSKRIIEAHNGKIQLNNSQDKGLIVTISLPVSRESGYLIDEE
jgi:two-component system, OmpR family, sensor kinase